MRTRHIHLVDESGTVAADDLTALAGALQTQVERDFGPEWGVRAQVSVGTVGGSPKGVWLLRIVTPDQLPPHAGGVHLDHHGKPYAIVGNFSDYTVAASHELLEMLVDPYGRKLVAAPSLDPDAGGRIVQYLVEVADPCEIFSYDINGVAVSDFVLQDYYNPDDTLDVDHLTKLSRPFEVPKGCYISWYDPADQHWHQIQVDGSIVTATHESRLGAHPRAERDAAFTDEQNAERHDLRAVFAAFPLH